MSLAELVALIPPPEEPKEAGKRAKFEAVEKKLRTRLPKDYKDFIIHFGTGYLANFIKASHFARH